jgi:hypothetical protein
MSLQEINLYVKLLPYGLKICLVCISCGVLTSAKLHLTVVLQLQIYRSTTTENSPLARKGGGCPVQWHDTENLQGEE